MKISPRDIYRLRSACLYAEGRALRAKLAQHHIHLLVLELERKYGLLGKDATLDIQAGIISGLDGRDEEKGMTPTERSATAGMKEVQNGPEPDAYPGP